MKGSLGKATPPYISDQNCVCTLPMEEEKDRYLHSGLNSRQPQIGRVASDQVYPMKFKLSSLFCQKIGPSLHLLSSHMVPCLHTKNSQLFPNYPHAKPRITLHLYSTMQDDKEGLLQGPPHQTSVTPGTESSSCQGLLFFQETGSLLARFVGPLSRGQSQPDIPAS